MTQQQHNPIDKAARLVLLMRLQDAGRLDGLTVRKIADLVGRHFTTISRDLKDIEELREVLKSMKL